MNPKNLVAQYHGITQLRTTNQQVHWVVQVINLTRVRVNPSEIVGMKQAMVILKFLVRRIQMVMED